LAFCEAVYKNCALTLAEQNDRAISARLALPLPRDPLFDDAAASKSPGSARLSTRFHSCAESATGGSSARVFASTPARRQPAARPKTPLAECPPARHASSGACLPFAFRGASASARCRRRSI